MNNDLLNENILLKAEIEMLKSKLSKYTNHSSKKKYYDANKDKHLDYAKEYYQLKKEEKKAYAKEYYNKKKEKCV